MQPLLPRRPPAPKALPWLVLAAHLAALLLVGQALTPHQRGGTAAAPRPLWLRLLQEPDRAAAAPPPREVSPPMSAEPRPGRRVSATPQAPAPAAAVPSAEAITPPPAEPPIATRTPEPPASAPLDLRVAPSRQQARPPAAALAREDPRANTSRLGSEQRLSRTLGTDLTLRESVDPNGTRTFRRGADCVVARPARESQLNPFNQSMQPTPRLVDKC